MKNGKIGEGVYSVYMHRHKDNGKIYIGCTKKKLSKRFENGNGYKKCTRFWEAIQADGFNSFEHIVVADGLTQAEAYEMEERLIDLHNAMCPDCGYNMRRGGLHNTPCEDVGRRISKAKMGHKVAEETRAKLRQYGTKQVLQLTLDGTPVRVFNSLTEAAAAVDGKKTNISAVCLGKKPSCRNYRWEYFEGVMR